MESLQEFAAREMQEISYQPILPADEKSYDALLKGAFGVPEEGSFFDDFPVWRSGHGVPFYRIGAFGSDRLLLSAASARTAYLQLGIEQLKVGILGGVVTAPEAQGKGYASQCVRACEEWLRKQGAAFVILWSGDPEWYLKKGYAIAGHQYRIPLSVFSSLPAAYSSLSAGDLRQGWCSGIGQQFLQRRTGLKVQSWDLDWIKEHRNTFWYWLGNESEVKAFAAIHRGVDLKNTIHEWSGDPDALRALFFLLNQDQPDLQLMGNTTVLRKAGILFDESASEPVALVKLLNEREWKMGVRTPVENWLQFLNRREVPFWLWGLDAG